MVSLMHEQSWVMNENFGNWIQILLLIPDGLIYKFIPNWASWQEVNIG